MQEFGRLTFEHSEAALQLRESATTTLGSDCESLSGRATKLRAQVEDLLKDPTAKLLPLLEEGDMERARQAKALMPELGEMGECALLSLMKHSDRKTRWGALWAVVEAGIEIPSALPVFIALLQDPDPCIRYWALKALARYPEDHEVIVPAVIGLLGDRDSSVASGAADVLASFGHNATLAVPALEHLLEQETCSLRLEAASALVRLGSTHPLLVPVLTEGLNGQPWEVRMAAAGLAELGPAAKAALADLKRAAREFPEEGPLQISTTLREAIERIEAGVKGQKREVVGQAEVSQRGERTGRLEA